MDFVTGLPISEGYDAIMVVVDRLTKMRHLIACHTTINPSEVGRLYLQNVWKHHGIPMYVTSDRGTQFTAQFWQSLLRHLKMKGRMSTPYHPETDGQTERLNAVMEQYLRHYVSYQQEDWVKWLPMAEFAANNQKAAATRVSSFFANYGFHPGFDLDLSRQGHSPQLLDAKEFAARIADLNRYLQIQMRVAQDRYENSVNKSRVAAPLFKIGDKVYVSAKNIRTTRNSRKLDWKRMGPYSVTEMLSPYAYRTAFPESVKIHPVRSITELELAPSDPLPGQTIPPPPAVVVDGHEEHAVDEILDSRVFRKEPQYLVKWTGYTDATWNKAEYITGLASVDAFHKGYPWKPGPWVFKARRSSPL